MATKKDKLRSDDREEKGDIVIIHHPRSPDASLEKLQALAGIIKLDGPIRAEDWKFIGAELDAASEKQDASDQARKAFGRAPVMRTKEGDLRPGEIDETGRIVTHHHPRSPDASPEKLQALAGIIKLTGPWPGRHIYDIFADDDDDDDCEWEEDGSHASS